MLAKYHQRFVQLFGLTAVLLLSLSMPAIGATGDTELISVSADGTHAAGSAATDRWNVAVNADGRYVAFYSGSTELVQGDTGSILKVFVRDRQAGTTELVSVGMGGVAANGDSTEVSISADGRFVCFNSLASNLVPNDTVNLVDVFVWDRLTKRAEWANPGLNGAPANSYSFQGRISADGRYVAFVSYASNLVPADTDSSADVFVTDRQTGVVERVNVNSAGVPGNEVADRPSISEGGRYVAFESNASNLVPGDINGFSDIFVRDRLTAQTQRISIAPGSIETDGGSFLPSISPDGRYVAFVSDASNLVNDDTNGAEDAFLWDRQTGQIERVSLASGGVQVNDNSSEVSISADGRYAAYSWAGVIFVRDRQSGLTERATTGGDLPSLSADGRFVAFGSRSPLSPLDTNNGLDVYVHEISFVEPGIFSYALTPQAISFGTQTTATSRTQTFSLRNTGTTALPVGNVTLTGDNPAAFSLTHNCGASITVGTGCAIKVTFRPIWVGNMSALVQVVAGNDLTTTRPVTGTGVRARDTVLPISLSFGYQGINTTSRGKSVTVTNTGSGALPIKSIYLSGQDAWQFKRAHNCPAYVPVGDSCTVRVYFKPWSVGAKTTTLTVWAGGGAGPKTVALTGTATPLQ